MMKKRASYPWKNITTSCRYIMMIGNYSYDKGLSRVLDDESMEIRNISDTPKGIFSYVINHIDISHFSYILIIDIYENKIMDCGLLYHKMNSIIKNILFRNHGNSEDIIFASSLSKLPKYYIKTDNKKEIYNMLSLLNIPQHDYVLNRNSPEVLIFNEYNEISLFFDNIKKFDYPFVV